ncbi:MAG: hypothetical protein K2X25_10085 [Caulobacteraceae bacterium]|nr:hypothetical protein [Caulobacteraceae bacterium]
MKRRVNWLAGLPSVATVGWWIIDKLAPDLLPAVPRPLALAAVALAVVMIIAALTLQGLHRLRSRAPGPWLAQPVWRSLRWVRERPVVLILSAAANAEFGASTLEALTIRLTLHRGALRASRPALLRFDAARLTLIQHHRSERRTWLLRPAETGDFLSLPMVPGVADAVVIDFTLIALPLVASHAPDLHKPWSLELDGVRATIAGRRPITGSLPKAAWCMAPIS